MESSSEIENIDDPKVWKNFGDDYFNKGEYEEAVKCYFKAIEINSEFLEAWNNLGYSYLKMGKIDEANKCKEKIKQIKTKEVNSTNNQKESKKRKGGLLKPFSIIGGVFLIIAILIIVIGFFGSVNNPNNLDSHNTLKEESSVTPTTTQTIKINDINTGIRAIPTNIEPFSYRRDDVALLLSETNPIVVEGYYSWYGDPTINFKIKNIGSRGITLNNINIWLEDYAQFRYISNPLFVNAYDGQLKKKYTLNQIRIFPGEEFFFYIDLIQFGQNSLKIENGKIFLSFIGDSKSIATWDYLPNEDRWYNSKYGVIGKDVIIKEKLKEPSYIYNKSIYELPIIERGLNLNPDNLELKSMKVIALFNIGYYPETIKTVNEGLTKDSSKPVFWYYLGKSQFELENYSEAATAFTNVISLSKPAGEYVLDSYALKAISLKQLGRMDEAIETVKQLLEVAPSDKIGQELYLEYTGKEFTCLWC